MDKMQCLVLGLAGAWVDLVPPMRPHRHQEVELTFIERGELCYLFGGRKIGLQVGQLAIFWAAIPHRVIEASEATVLHWLTIPLGQLLDWNLPGSFAQRLMDGYFIVDTTGACAHYDERVFYRWYEDLADGHPEPRTTVLRESEACLRRLAYAQRGQSVVMGGQNGEPLGASHNEWRRAERAAAIIAARYTQALSVADIASELGLHPHSCMRLFQKTFGMSIVDYITQYRLAQAQRLLATSDMSVLEIVRAAGFGSASRFYAAFTQAFGRSPRAYRLALPAGE